MTPGESTDSVRVAAVTELGLADLLHHLFPCGDVSELDAPPCWTAAQAFLASDWLADVVAQAKADERDAIERALQTDMDEMEKVSTTLATGLYRAVRWIQIRRAEATR